MGKGGGHITHLASSIAAASSRGPFRALQVAFAFSSKCFRLKKKKKTKMLVKQKNYNFLIHTHKKRNIFKITAVMNFQYLDYICMISEIK